MDVQESQADLDKLYHDNILRQVLVALSLTPGVQVALLLAQQYRSRAAVCLSEQTKLRVAQSRPHALWQAGIICKSIGGKLNFPDNVR